MKIELYSKDACPNCSTAKNLLTMKGADFTEYKIGRDITREEMFAKFPFVRSVPVVVVDGVFIGGLSELETQLARFFPQ